MTKRRIIWTEKPTLEFFPQETIPELVETETNIRPYPNTIKEEIQRDFRRLGRL